MNMKEAVISVLSNWNNFSDRACRSEFWYFQLAYIIVAAIVVSIELKFVSDIPLSNILDVLLLIPLFAVTARRLHAYGYSGWWQLSYILIIPIFVILVLLMLPAKEDENKWGRNPLLET